LVTVLTRRAVVAFMEIHSSGEKSNPRADWDKSTRNARQSAMALRQRSSVAPGCTIENGAARLTVANTANQANGIHTMIILRFLYNNGLWLSWPFFGLGVVVLWFSIVTVVRLADRNRICSLPLQAEQFVEFTQAGRVILWTEGPLLTSRFRKLSFELMSAEGPTLSGRMALFRQGSSGFSKTRAAVRIFTIPEAGRYVLHTKGLAEAKVGDEQHRILFMRPYLLQTVGCILGIILGAFLAIGSTVNFFLRLSQGGVDG
jgi:hypothetical protein